MKPGSLLASVRSRLRGARASAKARVLVVDDDPTIRATVRVTLASQGWEVIEAADPDRGASLARSAAPDVVLLDVNFAGHVRDGFAVCRELRSRRDTRDVPIVLFTANADRESRAFASAVGASAFLAKPFGPVELLALLRLVQGAGREQTALGLYLVDAGVTTPTQLERALAEQRLRQGSRVPLGEILVDLGIASASQVDAALGRQLRARSARGDRGAFEERRVLIADDHANVREGLRAAISAEDGLSVVGVATNGEDAVRLARELKPDVVVLDNDMPQRKGIDALPLILAELPQTRVVIFTLDDSIRDAALARGASAVITKDESLDVLIAALRRGDARPSPVVDAGVVLAARGAARGVGRVLDRQKRTLATLGVIAVGYAAAFLITEPVLGASAAVLGLVAVTIAGAQLGLEGGLAGGLIVTLLSPLLWAATGHGPGEPITTIGGNGIGIVAMIGVGAAFGAMRAVRGRLNPGARKAGVLAEAAAVLSTAQGPEALELVAGGALETAPSDGVLLFHPVPGGGMELIAARGVPSRVIGSRRVGEAIARARDERKTFITDAGLASIGVELPRMRRALVAPVAIAQGGVRGVLALLSTRHDAYGSDEIRALGAYAGFVGLAFEARAHVDGPRRSDVPYGREATS